MNVSRLQFMEIILLIGLGRSHNSEAKSDENQVIDLQDLLKDVSNSINAFNEERKAMSKELIDLKNTIEASTKDRDAIFNELSKLKNETSAMKSKSDEDHIDVTKQLTEINSKFEKIVTKEETESIIKEESKKCNEAYLGDPRDCWDLYRAGERRSGIYKVFPVGSPDVLGFNVYCDMTTDGGGWTVFQRRGQFGNTIDYFFKTWKEYKVGFGNLVKEFWLGNDKLNILTGGGLYELRVDLTDKDKKAAYAKYRIFSVENETQFYRLTVGNYSHSGNASDGLANQNGMFFTSKDVDKDEDPKGNCATRHTGAWWFRYCQASNLNGLNKNGPYEGFQNGVLWYPWKGMKNSLATADMKIRPKNAYNELFWDGS